MGLESRMVCTPHLVPPKKIYVSPAVAMQFRATSVRSKFYLAPCVALFLGV